MDKTLGNTLRFITIYVIISNIITVKYLYDVKEVDECNKTPMLTLVYDYYILELGVAITLLSLSFMIGKYFNLPKTITNNIIPFISKYNHFLFILAFIISCIYFYVLYEISSKKICNDVHPYLTYYLMYNTSSTILSFIYILILGFSKI